MPTKRRENGSARARKFYYQSRDKYNAGQAKYKAKNHEKIKAYQRQWYRENAEKNKPKRQEYARNNPDILRAKKQRYRAKKANAGGSFTPKEWQDLCDHYGNICLCCGESKPLEADHVIPVSKGGTSNIENIQPLCHSCNSGKCDRIVDYRPDNGYHIPKQLPLWS